MAFPVDFLHKPHMAGNGQALSRRRRQHHSAKLLRITANRKLLVVLEHRIELEGIGDALPCKTHNQAPRFRCLDLIGLEKMMEQHAIVIEADAMEIRQGKHTFGKLCRSKLTATCQRCHCLVV